MDSKHKIETLYKRCHELPFVKAMQEIRNTIQDRTNRLLALIDQEGLTPELRSITNEMDSIINDFNQMASEVNLGFAVIGGFMLIHSFVERIIKK
jgi:hypothetical protein